MRVRRSLALALLLLAALSSASPMAPADEEEEVPEHTDDEVKEAREEFDSIDTNHDGFISREEILEMEEVPEREEIDEFFNTYDSNSDGRVTFEEILHADEEVRSWPFFFIGRACSPHATASRSQLRKKGSDAEEPVPEL